MASSNNLRSLQYKGSIIGDGQRTITAKRSLFETDFILDLDDSSPTGDPPPRDPPPGGEVDEFGNPVYRDALGRIITKEEWDKQQEEADEFKKRDSDAWITQRNHEAIWNDLVQKHRNALDAKEKEKARVRKNMSEDPFGDFARTERVMTFSHEPAPEVIIDQEEAQEYLDELNEKIKTAEKMEHKRGALLDTSNKALPNQDGRVFKHSMFVMKMLFRSFEDERLRNIGLHGVNLSKEEDNYWEELMKEIQSYPPNALFRAIDKYHVAEFESDSWDGTLGSELGQLAFWSAFKILMAALFVGAVALILRLLAAHPLVGFILLVIFKDTIKDFGKLAAEEIMELIEQDVITLDDVSRYLHFREYLAYLEMLKTKYESDPNPKDETDQETYRRILREIAETKHQMEIIMMHPYQSEEERRESEKDIAELERLLAMRASASKRQAGSLTFSIMGE